MDGIGDACDGDDDGDTVLTDLEDVVSADGDPRNDDTDSDGTPNFLDNDDDNDTVLTADEDADGSGTVLDDDTGG